MALLRILMLALLAAVFAWPSAARYIQNPTLPRIDEVPVERLIANLKRNYQQWPADYVWATIGRLHLLAYIRNRETLPVHRDSPEIVAEGEVGDCAVLEGQLRGKPGDQCEGLSYDSYWRAIPAIAHQQPRRLSAHLTAAIDALSRAKKLDPQNNRVCLSLAFALDRALRFNEARAELRPIVYRGLRRTAPLPGYRLDTLDWNNYAVFIEAADHLARIPEDGADRQDAATLKRQLGHSRPPRMVSPILVPLKRGIAFDNLVDANAKAAFDFTGQGPAERMGWLKGDAAWLVWDPKRRGKIISGFQLFGSVSWAAFWKNGYHALGSLDDNGDGRIAGRELDGLALWRDRNGNGVSERGEVLPVRLYKIVSLSYAHERVRDNLWLSSAGVTFARGETRPTYDWVVRPAPVVVGNRR